MSLTTSRTQRVCYVNGSTTRIYVYPSFVSDSTYTGQTRVAGTAFGWIDPGKIYVTPAQTISANYQLGAVQVQINYVQSVRTGYIQAGSRVTESQSR